MVAMKPFPLALPCTLYHVADSGHLTEQPIMETSFGDSLCLIKDWQWRSPTIIRLWWSGESSWVYYYTTEKEAKAAAIFILKKHIDSCQLGISNAQKELERLQA